jgi:hypothetical protein
MTKLSDTELAEQTEATHGWVLDEMAALKSKITAQAEEIKALKIQLSQYAVQIEHWKQRAIPTEKELSAIKGRLTEEGLSKAIVAPDTASVRAIARAIISHVLGEQ